MPAAGAEIVALPSFMKGSFRKINKSSDFQGRPLFTSRRRNSPSARAYSVGSDRRCSRPVLAQAKISPPSVTDRRRALAIWAGRVRSRRRVPDCESSKEIQLSVEAVRSRRYRPELAGSLAASNKAERHKGPVQFLLGPKQVEEGGASSASALYAAEGQIVAARTRGTSRPRRPTSSRPNLRFPGARWRLTGSLAMNPSLTGAAWP